MKRGVLRGLGSLVAAASLAAGCSSSKHERVMENTYTVHDDQGGDLAIRITYDQGAQNDLQLGLYYLSQAKIDGMSPSLVTALSSDRALPYASLWADADGDAHITKNEASIFRQAAHGYSRGNAIPPEFHRQLIKVSRLNGTGVIGSKR